MPPFQGVTNFLLSTPYYSTADPNQLAENQVATVNWANETPFCAMFGVSTALVGANPQTRQTPTQTFLVQCGNDQPTFDALGRGTVTFPRKFPNAVIALSAISGTGQVYFNLNTARLNNFDLIATNTPLGAANALASGVIGVTWIAIGW